MYSIVYIVNVTIANVDSIDKIVETKFTIYLKNGIVEITAATFCHEIQFALGPFMFYGWTNNQKFVSKNVLKIDENL